QEMRAGLELEQPLVHQRLERHALPGGVELAPAGDAVDVHGHLVARQLVELFPAPALFLFYFAVSAQVPRGRVEAWHRPVVQHREAVGQRLPRRQPPFLPYLVLVFPAAEYALEHAPSWLKYLRRDITGESLRLA